MYQAFKKTPELILFNMHVGLFVSLKLHWRIYIYKLIDLILLSMLFYYIPVQSYFTNTNIKTVQ